MPNTFISSRLPHSARHSIYLLFYLYSFSFFFFTFFTAFLLYRHLNVEFFLQNGWFFLFLLSSLFIIHAGSLDGWQTFQKKKKNGKRIDRRSRDRFTVVPKCDGRWMCWFAIAASNGYEHTRTFNSALCFLPLHSQFISSETKMPGVNYVYFIRDGKTTQEQRSRSPGALRPKK